MNEIPSYPIAIILSILIVCAMALALIAYFDYEFPDWLYKTCDCNDKDCCGLNVSLCEQSLILEFPLTKYKLCEE